MRAVVRWVASNTSPKIASTRIRVLSVIRELRAAGIDASLLSAGDARCDVAVFCKAYRDADIALAKRLKTGGTAIVFDLCDNHFFLGEAVVGRLRQMMALADSWIFSTPALQAIAESYVDFRRPSRVIPDAVEPDQASWETNPMRRAYGEFKLKWWEATSGILGHPAHLRLIWFGNHVGSAQDSGMVQLKQLQERLEKCASQFGATLTIVSNSRRAYRQLTKGWKIRTFYFAWNLVTFLRVLSMHSIALLPFKQTEFNDVKSNNRLALSLFHGVAVVADSIPSYEEFGDCTFLDDWAGIDRYLIDEDLRRGHVESGRAIVNARYTPSIILSRWIPAIDSLVRNSR